MERTKDEINILTAKYLDICEDLRFRKTYDFKVMSGFITLNLVLAAWLTNNPLQGIYLKVGFAIFMFGLSAIACALFYENYRRRNVVVATLKNINTALEFNKAGAYGLSEPINTTENVHIRWIKWYCLTVLFFFCATMFIVFGGSII